MLIRFTVSNFLSFKDETEFNMLTGDVKRHPHHVYKREHIDVLRAAAIYGANGAGKSNLIKAIAFLKSLVEGKDVLKTYEKFKLSDEYFTKPSEIEIEFEINGIAYAYGIVFDHSIIFEEWLYKVNFEKEDEIVFERKTNIKGINKLKFDKKYSRTEKDKHFIEFYEKELLTPSVSFISTTKNEHFKDVQLIKQWFWSSLLIMLPTYRPIEMFGKLFFYPQLRAIFSELIKGFDTGLVSIDFKKELPTYIPPHVINNNSPFTEKMNPLITNFYGVHVEIQNKSVNVYSYENGNVYKNELVGYREVEGKKIEFKLDEESDGTIRLLDLLPIYLEMSAKDVVYVIDEINQSIHPLLLKMFLKEVMEMKESKGQIIFTTHESNLLDLDIFRQDEIWFAEKNQEGATQFYPLSEFKIRYDLDIRKGYLNGRFGAIPFLENLEKLNQNTHAEKEPISK